MPVFLPANFFLYVLLLGIVSDILSQIAGTEVTRSKGFSPAVRLKPKMRDRKGTCPATPTTAYIEVRPESAAGEAHLRPRQCNRGQASPGAGTSLR